MSKSQYVWIESNIYKTIGVNVGGQVKQIPIDSMGGGAIGIMFVYSKIPEGKNKENFWKAEI